MEELSSKRLRLGVLEGDAAGQVDGGIGGDDEARTREYSITTRYWDNTTGQAAHYQAGGSLRSINRNASLRSSLGLRPKVGGQNGDYIANPTAELYSTPL